MTITTLSSRELNQDVSRAKRAARHGPVLITDRGKPAHVLLSFEDCNDPPLSAQVMLLKHTLERVFSCRAPDAGVGDCRTGSSRPAHAWHAAGSQSDDGVRIAP